MPITWGGFGPSIVNKTKSAEILKLRESIDEALAYGKRIVADLTKEEKRALAAYRKTYSK